jgi:hypothetical protein
MCVFIKFFGLEYDQGPLAFIKELLLLGNILKALLLWTLKLRTVYCTTQVHTNKQVQQKRKSTQAI